MAMAELPFGNSASHVRQDTMTNPAKRVLIGAVAAVVAIHVGPATSGHATIAERLEQLNDAADHDYGSSQAKAEIVRNRYLQLFPRVDWKSLDSQPPADVELLFRAASLVSFYSFDHGIVSQMGMAVDSLDDRGQATPRHFDELYRAWISVRDFNQAQTVYELHHFDGMAPPPTTIDAASSRNGPSLWEVSPTGATLTRKRLDLTTGPHVVVIAHPLCHFTQRAVEDIEDSPLAGTLLPISTWIAPQDRRLDIAMFQEWNRMHSSETIQVVDKQSEWPGFDSWGTPTFYFVKDGVLVDKVVGWPNEGRHKELQSALRKIVAASPEVSSQQR